MKNIILEYKEIGETPLECLERVRIKNGISKDIPMTYAGRLDPLAEGLLLILTGEECKKKDEYLGLDKEYETEILLGIKTDSYDLLGMITDVKIVHEEQIDFSKYVCKFTQKYPAYSSKVIAMKNAPSEFPTNEVEIYSIDLMGEKNISGEEISCEAIERIKKVRGEFRQEKIVEHWQNFSKEYGIEKFKIIKIKVRCSSGTYMRTLADTVGGLAFSIKRTKIGQYSI